MTARLLIGEKDGDWGVFLSRRGVDVRTASDDDLLLSASKNFQYLMAGIVSVPANSQATILFAEPLASPPVVQALIIYNEAALNPCIQWGISQATPGAAAFPGRWVADCYTDRITFRNTRNIAYFMRYFVIGGIRP